LIAKLKINCLPNEDAPNWKKLPCANIGYTTTVDNRFNLIDPNTVGELTYFK